MSTTLQNSRQRSRRTHNPTGRGGYPSSNNYRRETPEPEPASSSPIRGLYSDHRTAVVMSSFLGSHTRVKMPNGKKYEGHTIGFSEKGDIAMRDAKLEDENSQQNPTVTGIIIPKNSFVVVETKGVDLKGLSAAEFTDSGIVNRINGSSETPLRELQPWQDDDAPALSSSLTLEDTATSGWDSSSMFLVNNEKFNVKSSYNEAMHEYTTQLPDPTSEGYEERQKIAQRYADEIEKSDAYQHRIAKELTDGDEESRFSAVHRAGESHSQRPQHESNNGKNTYTIPALRGEGEQSIRNGSMPRGQNRGLQRQNSPFSTPSHPQQQSLHMSNSRQMNNHYQGPPPSGGPPVRNQGPPPMHRQQQQQNHAAHHSHYQSPPPHPGMQQQQQQHHQSHISQPQPRPPMHHNMGSASQNPNKSHPPPPPQSHHQQNVPSSLAQQPPPQGQHPNQKLAPTHQQPPNTKAAPPPNVNGPSGPQPSGNPLRHPVTTHPTGDGSNSVESTSQKGNQVDMSSQQYHHQPPSTAPPSTSAQKVPDGQVSVSSSSSSLAESPQLPQSSGASAVTSPPATLPTDRRMGRGVETPSEEARNKIGQSLKDFNRNFVLGENGTTSQEPPRQEDQLASTAVSSASGPPPSSVASPAVSSAPETVAAPVDQASEGSNKATEKEEEPQIKSKLNPNAKEFKPKSQAAPGETQSPSPQLRSSPLMPQVIYPQSMVMQYHPNTYFMPHQRKRATVSLGAGDLQAHQVTGQPLLATQPSMMYIPATPGQPMPAGYPMINHHRMVAPSSLTLAPTGQVAGLEQSVTQSQPQPVFMPGQQQPIPTPIPAHLHHPQPPHAQQLPHPSSNQQAQPTHVPNPAPSPVQHQQHGSQPLPQSLPHHMQQGPPQSVTPQPAHYPTPMSISFPAGPRTSNMSGQQSMAAGHPAVSYPLMSAPQYTSYPNGSGAQYSFAHAAQPQTSQNSSHGGGHQAQYVVMPQPNPQHPPMQQPTAQNFQGTLPFSSAHNLMQGPPQMPPTHAANHNQGGHLIHSGVPAGLHQQVSGTQPGVYLQASPVGSMPPQFYMPRDGPRSAIKPTAVSAPAIMFTWP